MPRDLSPHNRAVLRHIESLGYRCGVGESRGVWYATAKRDEPKDFHRVRGEDEDAVVAARAESVGVDLRDR